MTQQHPITPPPELVQKWASEWMRSKDSRNRIDGRDNFMAARAAQWGAEQELEACCEWLMADLCRYGIATKLRAARRPKPASLKEQAIAELDDAVLRGDCITVSDALPIIRRALEQLND